MHRSKNIVWLFIASLLIGSIHCLTADTPISYYQDTRINYNTTDDQNRPSSATLNNGGFVIAWEDQASSGIFAQMYDFSASPMAVEIQVSETDIATVNNAVYGVSVCGLSNGGFAATFIGQDPTNGNTAFVRLFDYYGKPTTASWANDNTNTDNSYGKVAGLWQVNKFVLVWHSSSSGDYDIYAQIYNNDGTKSGAVFKINTVVAGDQKYPRVTSYSSGFVVTWQSGGDFYANVYSSTGTSVIQDFKVGTGVLMDGLYDLTASATVAYYTGTYIYFVWQKNDATTNNIATIYMSCFDVGGTSISTGAPVYADPNSLPQYNPKITTLYNNNFIVVWQGYSNAVEWGAGIFGKRYEYTGLAIDTLLHINSYTPQDQTTPTVAVYPASYAGYIVAWTSANQDGDGTGIYGILSNDCSGSSINYPFGLTYGPGQCTSGDAGCPDGTYAGKFSSKCTLPCNTTRCATCRDSPSNCLSCIAPLSLLNGQCVVNCGPSNFVQTDPDTKISSCIPCDTSCNTCQGLSTTCTSCAATTFLSGSTCVSTCPDGTYGETSTKTCKACDSSCSTCTGAGSSSCKACKGKRYLNSNNQCMTTCAAGFFADFATHKCLACTAALNCATCQNAASCATCSGTNYLYNSQCVAVASLPAGYYADTPSNSFKACDSTCATCSAGGSASCATCSGSLYLNAAGQCVANCGAGSYADLTTNTCKQCAAASNCATCKDASTCLSCKANYFLMNSNCISDCTTVTGYYGNAATQTCKVCDSTCATCSTTGDSVGCATCTGSRFLNANKQCVTECANGFYARLSDHTCQPCTPSSNCATCSDAAVCTSCTGTNYLYNSQCVAASSLPLGYYADATSSSFQTCDTTCATCSAADSTKCATCSGSRFLDSNGQCVTNCGDGFYANSVTHQCTACPTANNCLACEDATSCTFCQANYFLMNSQCVAGPAPTGFYQNTILRAYEACDSTCATCVSPGNSVSCASCSGSRYLNSAKRCVADCGAGFYADAVTHKCLPCTAGSNCATCQDANTCETCTANNYLFNSECVPASSLPAGYYKDAVSKTFKACDSTCATCSDAGSIQCATCSGSRYLNEHNQCITDCGAGNYADSTDHTCKPCDSNCATCHDSPTKCTSCASPLFLADSQCTSLGCEPGNYQDSATNACRACDSTCATCSGADSAQCDSCSGSRYLLDTKCITDCGVTHYADLSTHTCEACDSTCATCSGRATTCTSCDDSRYLLGNQCIITCPNGYYPDSTTNTCKACSTSCVTCSGNANACTSCPRSKYLLGVACVSDCGSGYHADASTNLCKST